MLIILFPFVIIGLKHNKNWPLIPTPKYSGRSILFVCNTPSKEEREREKQLIITQNSDFKECLKTTSTNSQVEFF